MIVGCPDKIKAQTTIVTGQAIPVPKEKKLIATYTYNSDAQ